MLKHIFLALSVSLLAVACGGGTPEPAAGDQAADKPAEAAPAEAAPAEAAPAEKPAEGGEAAPAQ